MQVKIIIGTIAFMLTMIILGFVALNEPLRLQQFSNAVEGRSIENGAEIFLNNCATCHGVNGRAEECFDAGTGDQIPCAGLPLNSADLQCGSPSPRLEIQDWQGAKLDYIHSTISSGRPWNGMPTWGEEYGGPLQRNQVADVAQFVNNWESEALCGDVEEVERPDWPTLTAELPEGDPASGADGYGLTFGCAACHGNPEGEASTAAVGPWLGDIAEEGGDRVEGYTAADYVYESILLPNAHIAPECPNGPCGDPSPMPGNFGERMTLQDMADVMAYLLGTTTFESEAEVIYPAE